MPKSLNRVQLLGNLGSAPEVKSIQDGTKVANFSIATTDSYKNSDGEYQDITDWHRIVLWGKLAEVAEKYLSKGSKIFIEGKLKTRQYEKDGQKHYATEVKGDSIIMLDRSEKSSVSENYNKASEPDSYQDDEDIPF